MDVINSEISHKTHKISSKSFDVPKIKLNVGFYVCVCISEINKE
jgi:hypothetical protein